MPTSAPSTNFPSVFHKILGAVFMDESAKTEPVWKQYLEEKSTTKKSFDDVELVEPGLWSETDEGADIDLDEYGEGFKKRYEPKKFAKRLIVPEELMEDAEYPEVYDAVRMLQNTCVVSQDYDAVNILNDAFTGSLAAGSAGDGVAVCSASHVLRGGGTASNVLATPLSPSPDAIQAILIAAEKMPGTNGYIRGVSATKVVCPTNLKWQFIEVLKSGDRPDTANRAINAIKGELASMPVSVPFMSSTTNWFVKTDAKRGAMWFWKRKPRFKAGAEIRNETEIHTGSARWDKGVSNWRCFIGSQA